MIVGEQLALGLVPAALAAVVNLVWMGFALGAVFRKLGGDSWRAWVPVLRWVTAAKHADVSTVVVALARGAAVVGAVVLLVGLVAWWPLILVGGLLWVLGSLTGWAMWIYGAGFLQLHLRAPGAFTWLAAISPPLWAAVLGWGSYGKRERPAVEPTAAAASAPSAPGGAEGMTSDPTTPPVEPAAAPLPERRPSPFALTSEAPASSAPSESGARPVPMPVAPPAPPAASEAEAPAAVSSLPPGWLGDNATAHPEPDGPGERTIIPPAPPLRDADSGPEPEPSTPPVMSPYLAHLPPEPAPPVQSVVEPTPVAQSALAPLPPVPPEPPPAATHVPAPEVEADPEPASLPLTPPPAPAPTPDPVEDDEDESDRTVLARRRRDVWVLDVDGAERYDLPDGPIRIGRKSASSRADMLGIADHTRTISKVHAELFQREGRWWVRDLGSTNGTALRGEDGAEREVDGQDGAPVEGTLLLGDLEARIALKDGGSA